MWLNSKNKLRKKVEKLRNLFKKNELKNLIYIQENKPCNEQTIKGLFRSIVEPILDGNVESLVLCRLEEKSQQNFNGILKRLEYSNAKVYDFSDAPIKESFENVLKENIWDKTEFIYILSQRYGAVLAFDYQNSEIEGFAEIYIMHNSKLLSDSFEIINSNSKVDLNDWQEKWHPDRRDNEILNNSIRKIIELLDETNQEVLLSEMEKEFIKDTSNLTEKSDSASRLDFFSNKANHIAHEIRNQLSICDLYSTIVQKQLAKVELKNEEVEKSLTKALDCIQKSLKIASNSLLDLKSLNNNNFEILELPELIKTAIELAKVYANDKDIQISHEHHENYEPAQTQVLADEQKFLSVLINLIKNAVESIEKAGKINIKTKVCEKTIEILISNNGNPITKELQGKIYEEGFTTKTTGCGLGLYICKKALEEQFGQLELKKSDDISTEFKITLPRI